MRKSAHWVELCMTRDEYFNAWECGHGPGQPRDPNYKNRNSWGDNLEKALKKLGITSERYIEVKKIFGLPPNCGCAARREWLNKVGHWISGR